MKAELPCLTSQSEFAYTKVVTKNFPSVRLSKFTYSKFYVDFHINQEYLHLQPSDKFMLLSKTNKRDPPCRRIDYFCGKYSNLGSLRIHYIGSKKFNR